MKVPIAQVDAFTEKPFSGNPAAVCILSKPPDEHFMQNVAREMNLSETAFIFKDVDLTDGFNLRWFTPTSEVDLCGHATLASAHVLWELNYLKPTEQARFHTKSGLLTAKKSGDFIELNFPSEPEKEVVPPLDLTKALGITEKYVGKNRFDYIVEVESEEIVKNMRPDFQLLKTVSTRGVMVTSISDSKEYDFVSRFFCPRLGINEDPVTGSAHCCLGPFWSERLNKTEFMAYQASSRGGVVGVRLEKGRVYLLGKAVTVLLGELL